MRFFILQLDIVANFSICYHSSVCLSHLKFGMYFVCIAAECSRKAAQIPRYIL